MAVYLDFGYMRAGRNGHPTILPIVDDAVAHREDAAGFAASRDLVPLNISLLSQDWGYTYYKIKMTDFQSPPFQAVEKVQVIRGLFRKSYSLQVHCKFFKAGPGADGSRCEPDSLPANCTAFWESLPWARSARNLTKKRSHCPCEAWQWRMKNMHVGFYRQTETAGTRKRFPAVFIQ